MTDLAPMAGSLVRVFEAFGTDLNYSSTAMQEVDMSAAKWGNRTRYTVYRITDATKRAMNDNVVPVFQKKVHGAGEWVTITPSEIWYGAGYIILADALNNDDTVQCLSGNYLPQSEVFGCATRSFDDKTAMKEFLCYGMTAMERRPTVDDWNAKIEAFDCKVQAEAVSTGGVANSHIQAYHRPGGLAGNGATFDLQDNNSETLAITVNSDDIVVSLKTTAGNPVSTANEVIAALNADASVRALGLQFVLPTGENGSGVVADSGPYTLAGGLDALDFPSMKGTRRLFKWYNRYSSGDAYIGFGYVSDIDWLGATSDLLKAGLSISGHQYPLRHVVN